MDSTILLLRCLERKYAELFISNGVIKFGIPQRWIQLYGDGNTRVGDKLEGVFAATQSYDSKLLKDRTDACYFEENNLHYYRSNSVLELPTLCMYGIHLSSMTRRVERNGHVQTVGEIPLTYFSDFSTTIDRDKYNEQPPDEQMVVVFINNPRKFLEKLQTALVDIGFSRNDIYINYVQYMDKKTPFKCMLEKPYELFLKDKSEYGNQSEFRIVIKSENEKVMQKFLENGCVLTLGELNDICSMQNMYYNKMTYAIQDGNQLRYTLSEPITTDLYDMSFEELTTLLLVEICFNLPKQKRAPMEDYYKAIRCFDEIFMKKFSVSVSLEKNYENGKETGTYNVCFYGASDEQNLILKTVVSDLVNRIDDVICAIR